MTDSFRKPRSYRCNPDVLRERGRLAAFSRTDRAPDDPELIAARQALKAALLSDHVRKVVAQAPPLTDEQRQKIANLLR